MNTRKTEIAQFLDVCRRNKFPIGHVRELMRLADSHMRNVVAQCNGPGDYVARIPYPAAGEIYAKHEALCEKREARIELRIATIAAETGFRVDCGGDPRGYTVRIYFPDGTYNTWGGKESGYGVPQGEI
jgi:hypothetical protein